MQILVNFTQLHIVSVFICVSSSLCGGGIKSINQSITKQTEFRYFNTEHLNEKYVSISY